MPCIWPMNKANWMQTMHAICALARTALISHSHEDRQIEQKHVLVRCWSSRNQQNGFREFRTLKPYWRINHCYYKKCSVIEVGLSRKTSSFFTLSTGYKPGLSKFGGVSFRVIFFLFEMINVWICKTNQKTKQKKARGQKQSLQLAVLLPFSVSQSTFTSNTSPPLFV